ncbi:leucyl/phenylalanyl-tRNA--protein transferase [Limnobacter humi]|uniref:Leucyl/phenylalanyl-tRNA--protein transferase n=1 Tax=Limnobacter humi TaxID=1778671 RepID=A0ABT1WEZ1_9BURK|nr:leucyl/phenylalanyl-tRNA--protein transferase [Limnobacter humi]MCQ8896085.1 leucyl/phenylalanyl-tRNA--protein transferase [Limnobacter humi]
MASITLPWLDSPKDFPTTGQALLEPAGLLAASDHLTVDWLLQSYPRGIFPWYSPGEPVLWWSTNPRAVLYVEEFKLHRSLLKAIRKQAADPSREIRLNHAFEATIRACAGHPRAGQQGTWITEHIIQAYLDLHRLGHAHSIEHWHNGALVGGLYCVAFGRMVFGESMFARETDASKVAFAYFVSWLKRQNVRIIDCQQATHHLLSLGARLLERKVFEEEMAHSISMSALNWEPCTLAWTNDPT